MGLGLVNRRIGLPQQRGGAQALGPLHRQLLLHRRLDELRSSAGVRPGKFPAEERERRRKAVERIVEQLHRETTQEQRDAMANADDWLYDEMGLPK